MSFMTPMPKTPSVIPANAGIQAGIALHSPLDSRVRGNDEIIGGRE